MVYFLLGFMVVQDSFLEIINGNSCLDCRFDQIKIYYHFREALVWQVTAVVDF